MVYPTAAVRSKRPPTAGPRRAARRATSDTPAEQFFDVLGIERLSLEQRVREPVEDGARTSRGSVRARPCAPRRGSAGPRRRSCAATSWQYSGAWPMSRPTNTSWFAHAEPHRSERVAHPEFGDHAARESRWRDRMSSCAPVVGSPNLSSSAVRPPRSIAISSSSSRRERSSRSSVGQHECVTERPSTRDDRDLVHRILRRQRVPDERVAGFVDTRSPAARVRRSRATCARDRR